MTTQAKMHTIELTENELARVLFVMKFVNGEVIGRPLTSFAFDKLGVNGIDFDDFCSKVDELAKKINLPILIDYYPIQKEWEAFLGIVDMDKDTLDKIAKLERELAELKGML